MVFPEATSQTSQKQTCEDPKVIKLPDFLTRNFGSFPEVRRIPRLHTPSLFDGGLVRRCMSDSPVDVDGLPVYVRFAGVCQEDTNHHTPSNHSLIHPCEDLTVYVLRSPSVFASAQEHTPSNRPKGLFAGVCLIRRCMWVDSPVYVGRFAGV